MAKKKTKTDLLAASRVLQGLLGNGKSPLSDGFLRWKIWRFWEKIVGPTLAKHCEPVGFERGKLFLWVKSAARMQEMRFFEEALKTKVNEHVGRDWVKAIRLTTDRHGVPTTAEVSADFKKMLEQDTPPE